MTSAPTSRGALDNRPLFIVGAPRSGTTLLQYMLRSHPRISLPTGESHFIVPLCRNASSFGDLGDIANIRNVLAAMHRMNAEFLDTDLHGIRFEIDTLAHQLHAQRRNTPALIIAGLFEMNARGEGKARWGDKTPYYVLHLPEILSWFPDAQVVHLIRDGRDCALSLFARRDDFGVYNAYHAAQYWQRYVGKGRQFGRTFPPGVYTEVRYEELVADPRATMQRLCQFLGEDYNDSVVNFKKSGEPGKTPLLQKPVQPDNAGKWRTQMSARQIRIFESEAANTLMDLGYELKTTGGRLALPLRVALRAHNRALRWWRKRRSGISGPLT